MFVTKKKHESLLALHESITDNLNGIIESQDAYLDMANSEIESCGLKVKQLEEENESLKEKVAKLELNLLESDKVEKSVASFYISDDLESIKPITKVKPEVVNTLVEKKYVPWNRRSDEFAVSLGVMIITYQALEQIIYSFEEAMKNDQEFSDGVIENEED